MLILKFICIFKALGTRILFLVFLFVFEGFIRRVISSSQTKFRQRGILKYLIFGSEGTILNFFIIFTFYFSFRFFFSNLFIY